LLVVGDARQAQAVNFFILPHQGIVRAVEHWRPHDVTVVAVGPVMSRAVAEVLAVPDAVVQTLRGQGNQG